MPISFSVDDMATSIQFAIAPIFLLVGTGSFLNVVTTRLGRVVDRARALEKLVEDGEEAVLEARTPLRPGRPSGRALASW